MGELKKSFVYSYAELKNVKTLAITAMLVAVAVILGFYTLQITEYMKIGFSFLANEVAALLFGPVVGGIMAAISDVVKYIVKPTGPFFPGFTISAFAGGVIYGTILYRKTITIKRIVAAKLIVTVVVNMMMNTFWISSLYGLSFSAIFPARALKQLIMVPIETIIFYLVAKALSKTNLSEVRGLPHL